MSTLDQHSYLTQLRSSVPSMPEQFSPLTTAIPTPHANAMAKSLAHRACRCHGLPRHAVPDIEQALHLAAVQRLEKYDASRASFDGFVTCIMEGAVVSEVRRRLARKRTPWAEWGSLDTIVQGVEGKLVAAHETLREASTNPQQAIDRHLDLAPAMEGLTALQQAVAQAIGLEVPDLTIARQLRISLEEIREARLAIHRRFMECGLETYC